MARAKCQSPPQSLQHRANMSLCTLCSLDIVCLKAPQKNFKKTFKLICPRKKIQISTKKRNWKISAKTSQLWENKLYTLQQGRGQTAGIQQRLEIPRLTLFFSLGWNNSGPNKQWRPMVPAVSLACSHRCSGQQTLTKSSPRQAPKNLSFSLGSLQGGSKQRSHPSCSTGVQQTPVKDHVG